MSFHKKTFKLSDSDIFEIIEAKDEHSLDKIGDDLLNDLNQKDTRTSYLNKINNNEISVLGLLHKEHGQFVYYCVLDKRNNQIKYIKGLSDHSAPELVKEKLRDYLWGSQ